MGTENIWKNWLVSPLGQKLLAEEKDWFDKNLEDIFGYHAVQICPYRFDSLSNNRIVYKYRFSFGLCEGLIDEQDNVFIVAPETLPLPSDSVDLFVLAHIFETMHEPHSLLREVERVLRPEGKLIISSFNPYGLWAINRYFNDVNLPLNGANWVSLARFKDWCKLLDLEIVGGEFLAFYPAINSPKWQKKLAWLQNGVRRWLPTTGAVYCLSIVKRREGMKLLKSDIWASKAKFGKKAVPSVSTFNEKE